MEAWQQAGVPLEAALKGIDRAFESHSRSRRGSRPMKSLAYCTDAVLEAAEEAARAAVGGHEDSAAVKKTDTFSRETLREHFAKTCRQIQTAAAASVAAMPDLAARLNESARSLTQCSAILDSPVVLDLEDLERRLTVLDDKIQSAVACKTPAMNCSCVFGGKWMASSQCTRQDAGRADCARRAAVFA